MRGDALDHLADLQFDFIGQVVIIAGADLVGRDLVLAQPGALDIAVEAIAGFGVLVHVGHVHAPAAVARMAGGLGGKQERGREQGRGEQHRTEHEGTFDGD